jgi:hypothetical protein
MGLLYLDADSNPAVPPGGRSVTIYDNVSKGMCTQNDAGRWSGSLSRNDATASQGPGFAADTYVTNSGLIIPSFGMKAGMLFRWFVTASKTAAGTAAAVYTVRIGAAQGVGDTARLALTAAAQTAAADNGLLIVIASVRNVGASGVIAGAASWAKTQAGTAGLGGSIDGVSSTFDNSALAGQYVGLSINGGASAAWTLTAVSSELIG